MLGVDWQVFDWRGEGLPSGVQGLSRGWAGALRYRGITCWHQRLHYASCPLHSLPDLQKPSTLPILLAPILLFCFLQVIFNTGGFAPGSGASAVGLLFRLLPGFMEPLVFDLFFRAVVGECAGCWRQLF